MRRKFIPKEDITAYELSLVVAELDLYANETFFKDVPDGIERHFGEDMDKSAFELANEVEAAKDEDTDGQD